METPEQTRQRWQTRRRLTLISFWILPVSFILCLIFAEQAAKISGLTSMFFGSQITIVLAYFGFSTLHDVKTKKGDNI